MKKKFLTFVGLLACTFLGSASIASADCPCIANTTARAPQPRFVQQRTFTQTQSIVSDRPLAPRLRNREPLFPRLRLGLGRNHAGLGRNRAASMTIVTSSVSSGCPCQDEAPTAPVPTPVPMPTAPSTPPANTSFRNTAVRVFTALPRVTGALVSTMSCPTGRCPR